MTAVNVTLTKGWLTDVADPTQSIHAPFLARGLSSSVDGGVRTYAGGRVRIITSARSTQSHPIEFRLSAEHVTQLLAWRGRLLLLRDLQGTRVFGSFFQVDVADTRMQGQLQYLASLTLTQVTYSEAV